MRGNIPKPEEVSDQNQTKIRSKINVLLKESVITQKEALSNQKEPGLANVKQTALCFIFYSGTFDVAFFVFNFTLLFGFYLCSVQFFLSSDRHNFPSVCVIKHFSKGGVKGRKAQE